MFSSTPTSSFSPSQSRSISRKDCDIVIQSKKSIVASVMDSVRDDQAVSPTQEQLSQRMSDSVGLLITLTKLP